MKKKNVKKWMRRMVGGLLCMSLLFGMNGVGYAQDEQPDGQQAAYAENAGQPENETQETAEQAGSGEENLPPDTETEEPISPVVSEPMKAAEYADSPEQEEIPEAPEEPEPAGDMGGMTVSLKILGYGETLQDTCLVTMPQEYRTLQDYGFLDSEADPGAYSVLHVLAEYAVQNGYAAMGSVGGYGKMDVTNGFLNDWFGYNERLGMYDGSSGVGFMYLADGKRPEVGMASYTVTEGTEIILYDAWWYFSGAIYESGAYAAFGSVPADAEAGKPFPVQMQVIGGSADGIQIEVLDADGNVVPGSSATKTDADGTASVIVPQEGTYTLTAMKYSAYYGADGKPGQLINRVYTSVQVAKGQELTDEEAVRQAKEQLAVPQETAENPELPNSWGQHLGGDTNNAVTQAPMPTEGTTLQWESRTEEEATAWGTAYAGHPILVNGNLYVVRNQQLQVLDAATGKKIQSAELAVATSFYSYPAYGEGKIFVPLGNGQVQCFHAETLESLFLTYVPKAGMQGLSSIHYKNGRIYVGYTNAAWVDSELEGGFAAYSALDPDRNLPDELVYPDWTYEGEGSYYGMGAVTVTAGKKEFLVFAGDDGTVVCADPVTGEVKDTQTVQGKVRCALVYAEDAVWFTSQDGSIYKYVVGTDGTLAKLAEQKLPGITNASPVVANGKVFVTGGVWGAGYLSVFDLKLQLLAEEKLAGAANTPTVTTRYEDSYVYFTVNASPDTLYGARVTADNRIHVEALYTSPEAHAQYSMSNVVVAEDGTIYYGNDAGYLIALKSGTAKPVPPTPPIEPEEEKPEKPTFSFTTDTRALQTPAAKSLKVSAFGKKTLAEKIAETADGGKDRLLVSDVPESIEAEVFAELAKHLEFLLILDCGTYTLSIKGADVKKTDAALSTKLVEKENKEHRFLLELSGKEALPGKITIVYRLPEDWKNAKELYFYEPGNQKDSKKIVVENGYAMFEAEHAGEFVLTDLPPEEEAEAEKLSDQEEKAEAKETKEAEAGSRMWIPGVLLAGIAVLAAAVYGIRRKKRKQTWEE